MIMMLARSCESVEELPARSEQENHRLTWRRVAVRLPAPFHCLRRAAHMRALPLERTAR
jgi:hypothetical protein